MTTRLRMILLSMVLAASPAGADDGRKDSKKDDAGKQDDGRRLADLGKLGKDQGPKGKDSPSDLDRRIAQLEKQVQTLAALVKQSLANQPTGSERVAKPTKLAVNPLGSKGVSASDEKKQKLPVKKEMTADGTGAHGSPLMIKGKDGQMYVRLSVLPEELQDKIRQKSQSSENSAHETKKGDPKKKGPPQKKVQDDD